MPAQIFPVDELTTWLIKNFVMDSKFQFLDFWDELPKHCTRPFADLRRLIY